MHDGFINIGLVALAFLLALTGVLTDTVSRQEESATAKRRRSKRKRKGRPKESKKIGLLEKIVGTKKGRVTVTLLIVMLALGVIKEINALNAEAKASTRIQDLQSKLTVAEQDRLELGRKLSDASNQLETSLIAIGDLRDKVDAQTAKSIDMALSRPLSLGIVPTKLPITVRASEDAKVVRFYGFDCKLVASLATPATPGENSKDAAMVTEGGGLQVAHYGLKLLNDEVKEYRVSWSDKQFKELLRRQSYREVFAERDTVVITLLVSANNDCEGRYGVYNDKT